MMNNPITYISTRGKSKELKFKDVVFEGLATDGGLYIPKIWPKLTDSKIESFKKKSYQEIAFDVISVYVDETLNDSDLRSIISDSYSVFENDEITPLKKIDNHHYLLELYHGPTYAFKDVAMQFISRLMDFYLQKSGSKINILGATSGDTGAAAIEGFKNIPSVKTFILHPHEKISEVQRKFMTTVNSENVFNIAIKGSFDDCQNIIKKIFTDKEYKKHNSLTAINSINWSRIMCQMVYYFYASSRISDNNNTMFSVPTGNFGDILAGYIAKKMGLNISMLNIATNENDILTRTLSTGTHSLKKVKETTSPSIDIQISSNFERLLYDLSGDSSYVDNLMNNLIKTGSYQLSESLLKEINSHFVSYSVSEAEVDNTIKEIYNKYQLVIDPHTAVGLASALKSSLEYKNTITLATAHPAKFKDTVSNIIKNDDFVTDKIKAIMELTENMVILENDDNIVKKYITDNI